MILDHAIGTVRSVSDLLADLSACRQLRHVPQADKLACAEAAYASRRPGCSYIWVFAVNAAKFRPTKGGAKFVTLIRQGGKISCGAGTARMMMGSGFLKRIIASSEAKSQ